MGSLNSLLLHHVVFCACSLPHQVLGLVRLGKNSVCILVQLVTRHMGVKYISEEMKYYETAGKTSKRKEIENKIIEGK